VNIFVRVLGANITGVYGTVIPPDFDASKSISSWEELAFDELEFLDGGDENYTANYDKFTLPGEYHIIVSAENPDGTSDLVQTTVVVEGAAEEHPWDVNDDGEVDISDLVLVGSNFGKEGENITGDVNGDDVVDILDLVLVGSHFGESYAAAPVNPRSHDLGRAGTNATYRRIYELLKSHPNPNANLKQALTLLATMLEPFETKLLQNYPNPFNPETFIPYQLAKPANVAIYIYNLKGELVRTLCLGMQTGGRYARRNKAAYWDGRNEAGESVASGVYIYKFTAGDFSAVRKMLIVR